MKRLVLLVMCATLTCLPLLALAEATGDNSAEPALTQEERAIRRAERQAKKENREKQNATSADLRASIETKRKELSAVRDENHTLRQAYKTSLKAFREGKSSLTAEQKQTLRDLRAKLQEIGRNGGADHQAMGELLKQARACLGGEDTVATQTAYQAVLKGLNARYDESADANALLKEISTILQFVGSSETE